MNCYLVGTGNRDLNSPLNWSSTSGGTPADVLGSELIGVLDLNNWTNVNIVSKTQTSFITSSTGGVLKSLVVVGKKYKCTIEGVTTVNNFMVVSGGAIANYYNKVGSGAINTTFYFTATNNSFIYLRNYQAGTTTITLFTLQEVLSVPNSSNPAIIDANSSIANGDVLSLSAQFDCGGFDCSAAAYTFTLSNAAYAFNVYGDLKDSTKRVNGFSSTGYLYIRGNCNIYSNGATQGWNMIYFNGVGATFTNQDDWNAGNTSISFFNGGWLTNNKDITFLDLVISTGTKALTLNSNNFNIRQWINQAPTNFTFTPNTSKVRITNSSLYLLSGGDTFYNLEIVGANIITSGVLFGSNITVQNTLTLSGNNAQNYRLLIASNTIGTPRTITVNGSIVASNVDFRDITLAGTANRDLSAISGGSGDCGGNSGITFTPAIDCYIKHTSGAMNASDATKWVTTDGGTTQARVPLMQDRAWGTANSFTGTATINMNCPRIGSIDLSGVNQAVNFALANDVEVYGSYILGNNLLFPTANRGKWVRPSGRTGYVINTANQTDCYLYFNSVSNYTFIAPSYIYFLDLSLGNVNFGNFTHFATSDLGGIRFIIGSSANVNLSLCTIVFQPLTNTANNIGLNGGGKIFNKVIFSGQHTGNFVISDNNIFNELIIEKGRKVQVTGGSTQTISPTGKFIADGTPTEQMPITSTNTTPFNLVYAGTGFHQVNYCNISYCNATDNRFYAGKNSVDGGNNTGWKFRSYLAQNTQIL